MKNNFAGIPDQYSNLENASIILIPVPYDGTSTWQKGADQGPQALLEAASNMELYDIETDSEVYRHGIHLTNPVTENASPESMVEAVHQITKKYLNKSKFVTLIGGEHSISIGSIRAFNEYFNDLTVLHIDAHADLRKEYEGSTCNHACALYEANQTTNLIQVGIRSMDKSETRVMNRDKVFFAHEMVEDDYWKETIIELLGKKVYITFDLDAFDPSIMPSTGTPEPGGLLWYETLDFLKQVFQERDVVGFDIVELCPNALDKSSDFLAAKLYYKMLSYKFSDQDDSFDRFENNEASNDFNSKLTKFKDSDNDDF